MSSFPRWRYLILGLCRMKISVDTSFIPRQISQVNVNPRKKSSIPLIIVVRGSCVVCILFFTVFLCQSNKTWKHGMNNGDIAFTAWFRICPCCTTRWIAVPEVDVSSFAEKRHTSKGAVQFNGCDQGRYIHIQIHIYSLVPPKAPALQRHNSPTLTTQCVDWMRQSGVCTANALSVNILTHCNNIQKSHERRITNTHTHTAGEREGERAREWQISRRQQKHVGKIARLQNTQIFCSALLANEHAVIWIPIKVPLQCRSIINYFRTTFLHGKPNLPKATLRKISLRLPSWAQEFLCCKNDFKEAIGSSKTEPICQNRQRDDVNNLLVFQFFSDKHAHFV